MSDLWTPSGPAIKCTSTFSSAQMLTFTSSSISQSHAVARIVNYDTTVALCAMVSAGATAGDAANMSPVYPGTTFFVMFPIKTPILFVTAASVYGQAGYALKG